MKNIEVNFTNLKDFNLYFEKALNENQIKFKRLNRNLIYTEGNVLFFTSCFANPDILRLFIKRYYGKYFIYLVVLNKEEYKKLSSVETLHKLDYIRVFNCTQFSQFDITTLKAQNSHGRTEGSKKE